MNKSELLCQYSNHLY